jgi:hypothetical protein
VSEAGELASEVSAARDRLVDFVGRCPDDQWDARPLGDDDPRSVGVIVDHVADAYEYIGTWVGELARGQTVEVTPALVDELNARHAAGIEAATRDGVIEHLRRSGDAIVALVGSLDPDQLSGGDGRVARLAEIAARHADDHRQELEGALGLAP